MKTVAELTAKQRRLAECHADALSDLFGDEAIRRKDLPDENWATELINKLCAADAVDVENGAFYEDSSEYAAYRLPDAMLRAVKDVRGERDPMLLCGHSGLKNVGDGYECGYKGCDEVFSRAEVQR